MYHLRYTVVVILLRYKLQIHVYFIYISERFSLLIAIPAMYGIECLFEIDAFQNRLEVVSLDTLNYSSEVEDLCHCGPLGAEAVPG